MSLIAKNDKQAFLIRGGSVLGCLEVPTKLPRDVKSVKVQCMCI